MVAVWSLAAFIIVVAALSGGMAWTAIEEGAYGEVAGFGAASAVLAFAAGVIVYVGRMLS